jgi:nucleoside 2-deoxyribosyltransferase
MYSDGSAQTTEAEAAANNGFTHPRIKVRDWKTDSPPLGEWERVNNTEDYIKPNKRGWVKPSIESIYIVGSLRNTNVPLVGDKLREAGFEAFEQWYSAGPEADDHFKQYHIDRGNSYEESLKSYAAKHIFSFDKFHLDRCDAALLVLPAGRSCHIELGYVIGQGKPAYVLLDNEEGRWDLMYQFATGIYSNLETLIKELNNHAKDEEVSNTKVL